jgi:hypothetical protein
MSDIVIQIGRTVRYSLAGWARTIRLCMILIVVVVIYTQVTHR